MDLLSWTIIPNVVLVLSVAGLIYVLCSRAFSGEYEQELRIHFGSFFDWSLKPKKIEPETDQTVLSRYRAIVERQMGEWRNEFGAGKRTKRATRSLIDSKSGALIHQPVDFVCQRALSEPVLIAGSSGSGKTWLLAAISCSKVWQESCDQKIPIMIRMSDWKKSYISFEQFVIQHLQSIYRVPKGVATTWLKLEQLALLLDGLDEVPDARKSELRRLLNKFLSERALTPVISTSSIADTDFPGQCFSKLELQLLADSELQGYLQRSGRSGQTLKTILRKAPDLRDLLRIPFLLDMYVNSYRATKRAPDQQSQLSAGSILERYLAQNLAQLQTCSAEAGRGTLAWIATAQMASSHPCFIPAQLQPTLLRRRGAQLLYVVVTAGLLLLLTLPLILFTSVVANLNSYKVIAGMALFFGVFLGISLRNSKVRSVVEFKFGWGALKAVATPTLLFAVIQRMVSVGAHAFHVFGLTGLGIGFGESFGDPGAYLGGALGLSVSVLLLNFKEKISLLRAIFWLFLPTSAGLIALISIADAVETDRLHHAQAWLLVAILVAPIIFFAFRSWFKNSASGIIAKLGIILGTLGVSSTVLGLSSFLWEDLYVRGLDIDDLLLSMINHMASVDFSGLNADVRHLYTTLGLVSIPKELMSTLNALAGALLTLSTVQVICAKISSVQIVSDPSKTELSSNRRFLESICSAAVFGSVALLVLKGQLVIAQGLITGQFEPPTITGVCFGISLGGTIGATIASLPMVQNHVLLWLLHMTEQVPLNLQKFLDDAVHARLLGRTNGGFVFHHKMIQDYFADHTNDVSMALSQKTKSSARLSESTADVYSVVITTPAVDYRTHKSVVD